MPTCHTSWMYLAFVVWFDQYDIDTMGTPALSPSTVEFHLQCVMKHPTDRCAQTSSCWHCGMTRPLPHLHLVREIVRKAWRTPWVRPTRKACRCCTDPLLSWPSVRGLARPCCRRQRTG
ncbi:hypothetical protein PR202_ga16345 [Eleusine coracana subsp. coracana]|uniref:Secreted protein n=1 Tax=Eleusine coracana subsp. coracana TaxID=191504 RepID=A0AAV5CLR2_ELECO|nr:hypothetical protein PR202_ga16345 [Eleusine coracana subsp. coracana]